MQGRELAAIPFLAQPTDGISGRRRCPPKGTPLLPKVQVAPTTADLLVDAELAAQVYTVAG
jgi:hypothetical protein